MRGAGIFGRCCTCLCVSVCVCLLSLDWQYDDTTTTRTVRRSNGPHFRRLPTGRVVDDGGPPRRCGVVVNVTHFHFGSVKPIGDDWGKPAPEQHPQQFLSQSPLDQQATATAGSSAAFWVFIFLFFGLFRNQQQHQQQQQLP